MGQRTHILLLTILLSLLATDAFARNGRQSQIPNNQWGCDVCHTAAGGLNDFGFDSFDYTSGGTVNWAGLSQEDSDRDGYSNGLELADPNGTGGNNGGMITHPGDRSSGLCGNGSMEGAEECEAGDLGGATCASMGLVAGNLSCGDTCRFDTSSCDACGDNMIAGSEECDGTDLGGNTCESLGRGPGTLACTGCAYNYVGCEDNSAPASNTCGDGIRQTDESCDGSDLGGQTCATLGFTGGLLSCAVRCTHDTSACTGGTGINGGGGTTPGQTPNGTGGMTNSGTPVQDDPDQKIDLQGEACSTTPNAPAPSGSLLLMLLGLAAARRARRRG